MPVPGANQLVRCMHAADRNAAGGTVTVHWLEGVRPGDVAATAESILARQEVNPHTSVFVARDESQYVAESYTPAGTHIQFCGHGALAAAWVVFNEHAPTAAVLDFANVRHTWQARRSAAAVAAIETDITLTYCRPLVVACAVPAFAPACLGCQPVAAAEVGGPSDYLLLELTDPDTVQQLQPDFAAISAATDRALIATAKSINSGCVFRYFAPQYGAPEDAATGSAAVQLAAYWAPQLKVGEFAAHQLSPQGASMQLRCDGATVELTARVGYG